MSHRSVRLALAGALLTLAALPAAALAGPPGKWTQVTGIGQEDLNILDASVARTPDGVLHVGWMRDVGIGGTVLQSTISKNAKSVSGPVEVASYSGGINEDTVILSSPEGLRMFFAGLNTGTPLDRVVSSSTSTNGGASWSPATPVSDTSTGKSHTAYAAQGIAAARLNDGNFLSAWGAVGSEFHVGLDPSTPDGDLFAGSPVDPGIGVDSQSGQALIAANLLDEDNVAYSTPGGPRSVIPGSGAEQLQHAVGITGRIGQPGLYIAYTRGTNMFLGKAALWNVGTGKGLTVGTKRGDRAVSVAAAPGGRLWVFWFRADREGVYATRSNPDATSFGETVFVKAPKGTQSIFDLTGEGSAGPLDVLLLADRGQGPANWHQRILPGLHLAAKVGNNGKVTFKVTDAGDAVKGAKVKLKGDGSKTTGAKGTVSFTLSKGRFSATASKGGFTSDSVKLRVK